jgi:hypothetical protein
MYLTLYSVEPLPEYLQESLCIPGDMYSRASGSLARDYLRSFTVFHARDSLHGSALLFKVMGESYLSKKDFACFLSVCYLSKSAGGYAVAAPHGDVYGGGLEGFTVSRSAFSIKSPGWAFFNTRVLVRSVTSTSISRKIL